MKKTVYATIAMLLLCVFAFTACSAGGLYDKDMSGRFYPPDGSQMDEGSDSGYIHDEIKELDFVKTDKQAEVFLSLDRNTSGYSLMRRTILGGHKVATDSVRLEDYINYFNYTDVAHPEEGKSLAASGTVTDCPWNADHKLLRVNVAAEQISTENKRVNNVVFLIDTSGSMYWGDRLPLVQQAFTAMLPMLTAEDRLSVVTYAGEERLLCEGVQCTDSEKAKVAAIIEDLEASGSTNGEGGLKLAYKVAEKYFVKGGNNRILLATDGDFNVGAGTPEQLKKLVSDKKSKAGVGLSILGVGMGNTRDDMMQALSKNGDGNAYYIDNINEARKVLVEEFGGTMNTVAYDAKAGVTFNADVVDSYRIIGYENSLMSEEDFNDDNKDAGEIGSGHVVTAVYEIALKDGVTNGKVCDVTVKYRKEAKTDDNAAEVVDVTAEVTLDGAYTPTADDKFVACVVEFGLILRDSKYKGDANFADILQTLDSLGKYVSEDSFKAEFVTVVNKAAEIYGKAEV